MSIKLSKKYCSSCRTFFCLALIYLVGGSRSFCVHIQTIENVQRDDEALTVLMKDFACAMSHKGSSINYVAAYGGRGGCQIVHVCLRWGEGGSSYVYIAFFALYRERFLKNYIKSDHIFISTCF